jgi:hypothetical protein
VLARGRRRLAALPSPCRGLDLAALLAAADRWDAWLAAPHGEPPPAPRIVVVEPSRLR